MLRFDPDERPDATTAELDRRLARLTESLTDEDHATFTPPDAVWDGIVASLSEERRLADRPVVLTGGAPVQTLRPRRARWMIPATAAAAVAVLAGVVAAVVTGDDRSTSIELAAAPMETLVPVVEVPGASTATATAKLVRDDGGTMHVELVDAAMPDVPAGYHYEIWLVDPDATDPHSLSRGAMAGKVDFEVPPDLDPADYPIIDVSVEPNDGDPTHAGLDHSILRGRLEL